MLAATSAYSLLAATLEAASLSCTLPRKAIRISGRCSSRAHNIFSGRSEPTVNLPVYYRQFAREVGLINFCPGYCLLK
jgi:hypothetical protein